MSTEAIGSDPPGAGVRGGCETSNVGSENQILFISS